MLPLLQIVGIVMACFVAVYKRDDNKYEIVWQIKTWTQQLTDY